MALKDVENAELILRVVDLLSSDDNLYLTLGDQVLISRGARWRASVNVNDCFYWGTADAEEITEENIDMLEQALKDTIDLENSVGNKNLDRLEGVAEVLFAARVRKMRPQGALYKYLPVETHALFDACGPERETNLWNPHGR